MEEILKKYRENKNSNPDVDWNKYLELNQDLVKANITTAEKVYTHWFNYAIREIRNYSDKNKVAIDDWDKISNYLRNNYYIAKSWAFIVTTCVRSQTHLTYLKECIRHIRRLYPTTHIYVINDNSSINIDVIKDDNLEIIDALARRAGELNPYLFGMDERCKHDKLVYIHDTVFIKKKIDIYIVRNTEIDFLWYDITAIHNDTVRIENADILNNLNVYFSNSKMSIYRYLTMVKQMKIPFSVKFGSMAIFTKSFCEKLDLVTNIKEASKYFKERVHRCFLERLLSFFHVFIYGYDYILRNHICGNIKRHINSFNNVNINAVTDNKQSFVKVWQGR
jgi:hypothetical protein